MRKPNGYGCVYKLSGNRRKPFVARITVAWEVEEIDGTFRTKQKYHNIGYFPTQREAELALANYNSDPYDAMWAKITFKEAWDLFMQDKQPTISKTTMYSYSSVFTRCKPIHNKKAIDIKQKDIVKILESDKTQTMQQITKKKLKVFFDYLIEKNVIAKNPTDNIKIETEHETREGVPYTSEEIRSIWNYYKDTGCIIAKITLIQIYTGARISEVLSITKEDVDFNNMIIHVNGTKTKNAKRIVPIRNEIMELLQHDGEYAYGNKIASTTFSARLKKHELFGEKGHVSHDARHTFISCADKSNINQNALKLMVGHSIQGVTGLYTHKSAAELKEEIDKIKFI